MQLHFTFQIILGSEKSWKLAELLNIEILPHKISSYFRTENHLKNGQFPHGRVFLWASFPTGEFSTGGYILGGFDQGGLTYQ